MMEKGPALLSLQQAVCVKSAPCRLPGRDQVTSDLPWPVGNPRHVLMEVAAYTMAKFLADMSGLS